jgi:hypothetical protein
VFASGPDAVPAQRPAVPVVVGVQPDEEPAIRSVAPDQTGLDLHGSALGHGPCGLFANARQVVGVVQGMVATVDVGIEQDGRVRVAVVVENGAVGVLDAQVRPEHEDLLWYQLEDGGQVAGADAGSVMVRGPLC